MAEDMTYAERAFRELGIPMPPKTPKDAPPSVRLSSLTRDQVIALDEWFDKNPPEKPEDY